MFWSWCGDNRIWIQMTDLLIKLISCLNKCCCSHHTCLLPPHSISPTDTVQILTWPGNESKAYCFILVSNHINKTAHYRNYVLLAMYPQKITWNRVHKEMAYGMAEFPPGSVVKVSFRDWNVLSMIWRSWVWSLVGSKFWCIVFLSKYNFNQNYNIVIINLSIRQVRSNMQQQQFYLNNSLARRR